MAGPVLTPQEKDVLKAGGILAAVLVAAAVYFYYMIIQPQLESDKKKIEVVRKETSELKLELADMKAQFENLEVIKAKQAFLEKISRKLPNSPDAPGFYQALVKILEVTRVSYQALTPMAQADRTVYTEIPYRIDGRARFHEFGQFLNLIEENPDRFMRVKTFTVENDDTRPSVHPITVEIGTFMFNSKG